jgi:ArsR family transcriptional regulator
MNVPVASTIVNDLSEVPMVKRTTPVAVVDETACCGAVLSPALDGDTATALARGFAALADPTRLRLLSLLASADEGEVCVCDLTGPVGKSQPTVSHHLKQLADAGLVTGDKRGRWVWYRIRPERLAELRSALAI